MYLSSFKSPLYLFGKRFTKTFARVYVLILPLFFFFVKAFIKKLNFFNTLIQRDFQNFYILAVFEFISDF